MKVEDVGFFDVIELDEREKKLVDYAKKNLPDTYNLIQECKIPDEDKYIDCTRVRLCLIEIIFHKDIVKPIFNIMRKIKERINECS